jgi:hypothetical protein
VKNAVAVAVWAGLAIGLGSAARADWNTFQNDPVHDGYVAGSYTTLTPAVRWADTLPAGSLTGMAVGVGNVFVSSGTYFGSAAIPNFYAINTNNGAISWDTALGSGYSLNAPAYANGAAYVEFTNGPSGPTLYSFNASKGTVNYQSIFSTQGAIFLAPTVVNGFLYSEAGYDGGMGAFNTSNGVQSWTGAVPQYYGWTPTVDNGFCYVYTGSGNGGPGDFTMLNASNGALVKLTSDPNFATPPSGPYMNEAPAMGASNDAFVTDGGRLVKFGTTTAGGLLASVTDQYNGQPSVAHGMVYTDDGTGGASLAALTESTLSQQWIWTPPDGALLTHDNIVTDNLIIASTNADTYGISLSGQTLWTVPIGGNLALSGNTLYISSGSTVDAFSVPEPASGSLLVATAVMLSARRRRLGSWRGEFRG